MSELWTVECDHRTGHTPSVARPDGTVPHPREVAELINELPAALRSTARGSSAGLCWCPVRKANVGHHRFCETARAAIARAESKPRLRDEGSVAEASYFEPLER